MRVDDQLGAPCGRASRLGPSFPSSAQTSSQTSPGSASNRRMSCRSISTACSVGCDSTQQRQLALDPASANSGQIGYRFKNLQFYTAGSAARVEARRLDGSPPSRWCRDLLVGQVEKLSSPHRGMTWKCSRALTARNLARWR
jgi:hypothetical protein